MQPRKTSHGYQRALLTGSCPTFAIISNAAIVALRVDGRNLDMHYFLNKLSMSWAMPIIIIQYMPSPTPMTRSLTFSCDLFDDPWESCQEDVFIITFKVVFKVINRQSICSISGRSSSCAIVNAQTRAWSFCHKSGADPGFWNRGGATDVPSEAL